MRFFFLFLVTLSAAISLYFANPDKQLQTILIEKLLHFASLCLLAFLLEGKIKLTDLINFIKTCRKP